MQAILPILHMDKDYYWRWYLTDENGIPFAISANKYFCLADAKRDSKMLQVNWTPANDN